MTKTFIFDFDSTIFPGETLDEIIQYSLKGDEDFAEKSKAITAICNLGMSGEISMKESLKRRLDIAAPTTETIVEFVRDNQHRIEPAMRKILKAIQACGHTVLVVSGGFEEWIKPLLSGLVREENIHANQIKDSAQPMTFENIIQRDKETIIKKIMQSRRSTEEEIIMLGDGATDFSVFDNGIAHQFIGTFFYSGAENRKSIINRAREQRQSVFADLKDFIEYMTQYSL